MQKNNSDSVKSLFEQLTTEKLDEMLNEELSSEPVNGDAVRMILGVLWEREKDMPIELTPAQAQAWEKYKRDSAKIWKHAEKTRKARNWILRAASAVAALVLLVAVVPQRVEADSIWEKLIRWTDSVFDFFNTEKEIISGEYTFQTNNLGLQQVYDAVTELGVTFPVVPMWLPEEYELIGCETRSVPDKTYVYARFTDGNRELAFQVSIYSSNPPGQYQKDKKTVEQIERNGITYNIMRNIDRWSVVWSKENVECAISIDCEEETLNKILRSIFEVEET